MLGEPEDLVWQMLCLIAHIMRCMHAFVAVELRER